MSDETNTTKPAHTTFGCVLMVVVLVLVGGACTALLGNDSEDETAETPDTEASAEPADTTDDSDADEVELTDEDITEIALAMVWEDMTPAEQTEICDGVEALGAEWAAAEVIAGAGGDSELVEDVVEDWLTGTCL